MPKGKNYVRVIKNLCVRKNLRVRKKILRVGGGVLYEFMGWGPIEVPEVAAIVLLMGLGVRKPPGVTFDADSGSGVRILIGRTVTEIRSPEILPEKFSRPDF